MTSSDLDAVLEAHDSEALELALDPVLYSLLDDPASDGVSFSRVIARGATHLRLVGKVWTIDQRLHVFWLQIERSESSIDWTLAIDPMVGEGRRARQVADLLESITDVEWSTTRSGTLTR